MASKAKVVPIIEKKPEKVKDPIAATDVILEISDLLSKTRKANKITLEEAVEKTRIRYVYLKAMEEGNFDALPGTIYNKLYLKNYADFLGLNSEKIIRQYSKLTKEKSETVEISPAVQPEPYRKEIRPTQKTIAIASLLALGIYLLYAISDPSTSSSDRKENEAEETLVAKEQVIVPTKPESSIVLVATEGAKIELLASDNAVAFQRELQAGDTYFLLKDQEGLRLKVTPQTAVDIYLADSPVGELESKRDKDGTIALKPDHLKTAPVNNAPAP